MVQAPTALDVLCPKTLIFKNCMQDAVEFQKWTIGAAQREAM